MAIGGPVVLSENAEKKVPYYIKSTKDWLRTPGGTRAVYKVKRTFDETETGVIVGDTENGYELDIPKGVEFYEVDK